MHNIIEARQKNEVEGIVLQRFGRECCRIYRLLAIKGQLEQKQVRASLYTQPSLEMANRKILTSLFLQIGERAMAPKNVKELLYRLLKEKYVQVQVYLLILFLRSFVVH